MYTPKADRYSMALRLLFHLASMLPSDRNPTQAIRMFMREFRNAELPCPVTQQTLKRWIARGPRIKGQERLDRPFMLICEDFDAGKLSFHDFELGQKMTFDRCNRALETAINHAQNLMATSEFQAKILQEPRIMSSMLTSLRSAMVELRDKPEKAVISDEEVLNRVVALLKAAPLDVLSMLDESDLEGVRRALRQLDDGNL